MSYPAWLAGISLAFALLERARPRYSAQRVLRRGVVRDLLYVVWNGHFLAVVLALAANPLAGVVDRLASDHLGMDLHRAVAAGWAPALQFGVGLVAMAPWSMNDGASRSTSRTWSGNGELTWGRAIAVPS